jgi:hypothetical protein
MNQPLAAISPEALAVRIVVIRGQRVLLDSDLAALYEVETKKFNQQIKRNLTRFPQDFMFRLTDDEFESLRSQSVTSKRGGRRYLPLAFTRARCHHGRQRAQFLPGGGNGFTADVTGKPVKR